MPETLTLTLWTQLGLLAMTWLGVLLLCGCVIAGSLSLWDRFHIRREVLRRHQLQRTQALWEEDNDA